MKLLLPSIFILLTICLTAGAQDKQPPDNMVIMQMRIRNGDTVLCYQMKPVYIFKKPKFKNKQQYVRYKKLVHNVKRVLPYAKLAGEKYRLVEKEYLSIEDDRERKKYIRQIEREILNEYEADLKKLTITQGRILLKLLDREIGETSYEVLKELNGAFSAVFWQTLARIFGHNLKSEFDPYGDDKLLNDIVLMIEAGVL